MELKMSGTFERYTDVAGEYRFRLNAGNGEIILSSEGYTTKQNCNKGIESVKIHAPDDSNYVRKPTVDGRYMFNLRAGNNEIIGTSQPYKTAADRDKGVESVKANAPDADVIDV